MRTIGSALPVFAFLTVLSAAMLSACHAQNAASPAAEYPECGAKVGPSHTFTKHSSKEPTVSVPLPSGWRYREDRSREFVRGILDNPSLAVGSRTPNVLVAVDAMPLPEGRRYPAVPGWDALRSEFEDVSRSASVTSVRLLGKCGHPGIEIHYVIKGQPSSAFIVAVEDADRTWRARVNFLSPNPSDLTWKADTQTMIDGLGVSRPGQ